MRPGSSPENPSIIIEPKDINQLRFGLSCFPAVTSPLRSNLLQAFTAEKERREEPNADYWQGFELELPVGHTMLATLGHAVTAAKRIVIEELAKNPVVGSATHATATTKLENAATARAVLEALAGNRDILVETMHKQAEEWDRGGQPASGSQPS